MGESFPYFNIAGQSCGFPTPPQLPRRARAKVTYLKPDLEERDGSNGLAVNRLEE